LSKLTRVLIAVALLAAALPALLADRAVPPAQAASTLVFADSFDGSPDPAWTVHVRAKGSVIWQSQTSVAAGALKTQSVAGGRSLAYAQRALAGHPATISVDLDLNAASQSSATPQLPLLTLLDGGGGRLFQLLRARDGHLVLGRARPFTFRASWAWVHGGASRSKRAAALTRISRSCLRVIPSTTTARRAS
jgi:hypothetical protein